MRMLKPGGAEELATVSTSIAEEPETHSRPACTKALECCALLHLLREDWFSSLTYKNSKKRNKTKTKPKLIFYDNK